MKNRILKFMIVFLVCIQWTVAAAAEKQGKNPENENGLPQAVDRETFYKGYDYFSKDQYKKAAPLLFNYISKNSSDADDYEWAEFFLGISLKELGYSHASVEALSYLVTRKPNTKIVSYVLELFEEVTRTIPYDHDLLINNAVVDQDYGFVDNTITDFISYYQGVFDWQNGLTEWGDNHFAKIRKDSFYYYKYQYLRSLYMIQNNDIDGAIKLQTGIIESEFQDEALKNEIRKTFARLLYEKKEYKGAEAAYNDISENIVFQAQNLLERAWALYRTGSYEKAMGLLYALKAPVYKDHITPEYFLLKSFIYKDLCQYENANNVIEEFRDYFGDGLKNIYNRDRITDSSSLVPGLMNHHRIDNLWSFLLLLEEEKKQIKKVKGKKLRAHLEEVYSLKIEETTKGLNQLVKETFETIANGLLEYEEKANLMSYEIGLDMYQRIYERHYINDSKNKGEKDSSGSEHYYAFFPFQGEYWIDEFTRYEVSLEDKCDCMEEWDIFFK